MLSESEEEETYDNISKEIKVMIELYIESDKSGMNYFNCSKRKIDESRKIQKVSEGIKIIGITKFTRSKLDLNICEHFLDFIFSNALPWIYMCSNKIMKLSY